MIWTNKSTLSLKLTIRIVLIHLNSVQLIKQCKLMRKVNKNEYRNFGGIALCLPKLFSTLTACCLHSSLYFCLIFVWPTNTNTYLTSTNLDVDFSHVKTCEGIAPCLYFIQFVCGKKYQYSVRCNIGPIVSKMFSVHW